MPDFVLPILLALSMLALLWLTWKSPQSNLKLRESLFRNLNVPCPNLIALLLGATASLLPLASGTLPIAWAIWVFISALVLTMFLLIAVRPSAERQSDRFAWGRLVIIILGFGFGALIYQSRAWWFWLWNKYRLINEPHELLLEALFLLGVILGVFVVRNWAKEDKAFVESLSVVLGGTFIATVLGEVQEGLTPLLALAYYALGFTMSGTLNVLLAARLTANYINKQSTSSRALLDFLYGPERTKLIDGYFLKNFEDDPDYAKRFLKDTLLNFRRLVQYEFSERIDLKIGRLEKPDPKQCADLKASQLVKKELLQELNNIPGQPDPAQAEAKQFKEAELKLVTESILAIERQRPSFCYELVAIECEEGSKETDPVTPAVLDREHSVIYRRVHANKPAAPHTEERIKPEMFRVGVAIRRQDLLEYIVAPGPYLGSFPYFGSVAGLSVIVRQTIVMDRDRSKKFRSKDYRDGICPRDIEQWRGLDEIDFLSYVSIPIVSRLGRSTENPLGVVNIDTKLFLTPCELEGDPVDESKGLFRTHLTPRQLNAYAASLYEQDDKDVKFIEKLSKIIEPVLELYAKCSIGAP